jgi:nitrile hydratase
MTIAPEQSEASGAAGAGLATGTTVARPAAGELTHAADADVKYLKLQLTALINLLRRSGAITYGDLLQETRRLEEVSHAPGARVVARAWTDPAFKARLLADGKGACAELGIEITGYDELQVVENTAGVHHVVVCTTCSCSPAQLVGLNPDWYKSLAYRTRIVAEPRAVLREFGVALPEDVEVRVVDTTTQRRCLVLPQRPAGTEGLDEGQLAGLVTRDSLYGVDAPRGPAVA